MVGTPSTNGANGRAAGGRFAPGNPGGPGNPLGSRVAALRAMLLDAVSPDDLRAIVATLVAQAKQGDLAAIRELFDRLLGKPTAAMTVDIAPANETLSTEERREQLAAIIQELRHQQQERSERIEAAILTELESREERIGRVTGT